MSLVLRGNINRRLTIQEMDGNFTYLENLAQLGSGGGVIETTYSELVSLIDSSELVIGANYLITDFKTCYDQPDYDLYGNTINDVNNYKVGATHSLMVFAISSNQLTPDAYQPDYPNDKIKYDISYSQTFVTGGTAYGRITERIDEFNNRTDYDHREVLFKRYKLFLHDRIPLSGNISMDNIGNVTGVGETNFESDFTVGEYLAVPDFAEWAVYEVTQISSTQSMSVTASVISEFTDYNYYKTNRVDIGDNLNGYISYNQNNIDGANDFQEFYTFKLNDETIINNYIGDYWSLNNWDEFSFDLPNNVFGEDCLNNKIGNAFYNNTFVNDMKECNIGHYCTRNIYNAGSDFTDNKIGTYFENNIILSEFYNNIINDDFSGNKINNSFYGNNIFNGFSGNNILSSFNNNQIMNDAYQNNFYNEFVRNTILNEFHNNTIGDINQVGNHQFHNNKIGNEVKGNLFIGSSSNNTFGDGFTSNQVSFDTYNNVFGIECVFNDLGEDFNNNKIGNFFSFNTIGSYFRDNVIGNYFNDNQIGLGVTQSANFANNEIGHDFFNNNILEGFGFGGGQYRGNKIGNNFSNNEIGEYFYDNIIPDNFNFNIISNYFQLNDVKAPSLIGYDFTAFLYNITSISTNIGLSPSIPGLDGSYTLEAIGGSGQGATFDVVVTDSIVTSVAINNAGRNYSESDALTIIAEGFGGNEGQDIEILVESLSERPKVYDLYNCEIFRNNAGSFRLSYYDQDDVLNIEDIGAIYSFGDPPV